MLSEYRLLFGNKLLLVFSYLYGHATNFLLLAPPSESDNTNVPSRLLNADHAYNICWISIVIIMPI